MCQGGRHMGEGRRFGKDECGREGSIAPFPGSNWGPHASRDVVHSASRQVHIRDIARDRVRAREGMRGEEGPVSYTHLDVYKRQVFAEVAIELCHEGLAEAHDLGCLLYTSRCV